MVHVNVPIVESIWNDCFSIDSINYDAKASSIALKYDKDYYQVKLSDYSIQKINFLPTKVLAGNPKRRKKRVFGSRFLSLYSFNTN